MKKLFVVVVWLIAIGLIAYSFIKSEQWLLNGTLILGWLFFAIQLTMNHFEKVYLFTKRIWFVLANPDCIWNFQVVCIGKFDRDNFDTIESCFRELDREIRIISLSSTRKIIKYKSITFEVVIDESEGIIRFNIDEMVLSYRSSILFIDQKVSRLFELIQRKLSAEDVSYDLILDIGKNNPYFGLFVKRLNLKHVQSFNVAFKLENDKVRVSKKQIEINTDSLTQLKILSRQYLLLSPAE